MQSMEVLGDIGGTREWWEMARWNDMPGKSGLRLLWFYEADGEIREDEIERRRKKDMMGAYNDARKDAWDACLLSLFSRGLRNGNRR